MEGNIVVMLSGYMQSGKDTVGDYLCKKYRFTRYAFADILKDEVSKLFDIDRHLLDTQEGKAKIITNSEGENQCIRNILIEHGQERRRQDINYWVKLVKQKILDDKCTRVVITDWRFPNEHDELQNVLSNNDYKVYSWRICRWIEPPLIDISELALDTFYFDHVLQNRGTLLSLYSLIDRIIFRTGILPIFLTDIDDVVLRWIDGFKKYLSFTEYVITDEYPSAWVMKNWIRNKDGSSISDESMNELILKFNHSEEFEYLELYPGIKQLLLKAYNLGYVIVGISSCTDNIDALKRRINNLENTIGKNIFHKVICLPLGKGKYEILHQFAPSIWLDDNLTNVLAGNELGHKSYLVTRPWNKNSNENCVNRITSWEQLNIFN